MTFVVDPSSISHDSIKSDLLSFLNGLPDSAKWKDFFDSTTGGTLLDLIAGMSTYLQYQAIVNRRENYIQHAKNKGSLIAAAQSLGYSVHRGQNVHVKLTVTPNSARTLQKWDSVGSVKDIDLTLLEDTVLNANIPTTINVVVGEQKEQSLNVPSTNPEVFRFSSSGVTEDYRLLLVSGATTTVVDTSERMLDLLEQKFVVQSNTVGSVDVYYLNTPSFTTKYNTGDTLKFQWIKQKDLTFVLSDLAFNYGDVTAFEISSAYSDYESSNSIKVNAPNYHETQFVIRGREDVQKILKSLDTSIIDAGYRDISPAEVELSYVKENNILLLGDAAETSRITCVSDSGGSLGGKYFTYIVSGTTYFFWFDVANSNTAPTVSGTGVEVDIPTSASANNVASALQVKMNGISGITATVDNNIVTSIAGSSSISEGAAATGFSFTFKGSEIASLLRVFDTYRPMGVFIPRLRHPIQVPITLSIAITSNPNVTGNVTSDVKGITESYQNSLNKSISFADLESQIEALSTVKIARISLTTTTWSAGNCYQAGSYISPVTDNGFIYRADKALRSSHSSEPTWPQVIGNTVEDNLIIWECSALEASTTSTWAVTTKYSLDTKVKPTVASGFQYKVIDFLDKTGTTEPTWPTDDYSTVIDNKIVWKELKESGTPPAWTPSTKFKVGDIVKATNQTTSGTVGRMFQAQGLLSCTGTSVTLPTVSGNSVIDNEVSWKALTKTADPYQLEYNEYYKVTTVITIT